MNTINKQKKKRKEKKQTYSSFLNGPNDVLDTEVPLLTSERIVADSKFPEGVVFECLRLTQKLPRSDFIAQFTVMSSILRGSYI